jgi:hypothetical protein
MICQCSYIDAMRNPSSTFLLSKAPEQSLSSEGDDKFLRPGLATIRTHQHENKFCSWVPASSARSSKPE